MELELSSHGFVPNWHRYAETTQSECLRILPYSQLQATHEATKHEFQVVKDSVYAKDGEVSTIRRNMTKVHISFSAGLDIRSLSPNSSF